MNSVDITMHQNQGELTVRVSGRLDTLSAPELEEALETAPDDIQKLIFDFSALEYITSAGLRVILDAYQCMENAGGMVVRNVCPDVMKVFQITNFTDFLNIE